MKALDALTLLGILFCVVVLIFVVVDKRIKNTPKEDCRIELPHFRGKYCQKRDVSGNIYYQSADGKMNITIGGRNELAR